MRCPGICSDNRRTFSTGVKANASCDLGETDYTNPRQARESMFSTIPATASTANESSVADLRELAIKIVDKVCGDCDAGKDRQMTVNDINDMLLNWLLTRVRF